MNRILENNGAPEGGVVVCRRGGVEDEAWTLNSGVEV